VEQALLNTAKQDGIVTTVGIEQDPGSAGVSDVSNITRLLSGFTVKVNKPSNDKITRAGPVSAQCEAGNVKLVRGSWNKDFLSELENFPEDNHDDQVDTLSGAFNMFNETNVGTFGGASKRDERPHSTFAGSIGDRRKW
jgi:predicted phage terminase large subunit-like protein